MNINQNTYNPSPLLKATQIVLLILIVIGLVLLFTQKMWVPKVVSVILDHEKTEVSSAASLGNLSSLHLGQTAGAFGVVLTPRHVLDDSRCAAGVQCIWAGTVKVQADVVSQSGKEIAPQVFELNKPITTEAGKITLLGVLPVKKTNHKITDQEYVFNFEITKR